MQNGYILNHYIVMNLIASKVIERQWVCTCLRFLSEKNNPLLTLSGISANKNDSAIFIDKVLIRWKILNFKLVNYIMTLDKLKSCLQMIADLILLLSLVKWLLIWQAIKVIILNNYFNILLLPYTILAIEFLVYVNTF